MHNTLTSPDCAREAGDYSDRCEQRYEDRLAEIGDGNEMPLKYEAIKSFIGSEIDSVMDKAYSAALERMKSDIAFELSMNRKLTPELQKFQDYLTEYGEEATGEDLDIYSEDLSAIGIPDRTVQEIVQYSVELYAMEN